MGLETEATGVLLGAMAGHAMDSEVLDLSTTLEGQGYTLGGQPPAMGTDGGYPALSVRHSTPARSLIGPSGTQQHQNPISSSAFPCHHCSYFGTSW